MKAFPLVICTIGRASESSVNGRKSLSVRMSLADTEKLHHIVRDDVEHAEVVKMTDLKTIHVSRTSGKILGPNTTDRTRLWWPSAPTMRSPDILVPSSSKTVACLGSTPTTLEPNLKATPALEAIPKRREYKSQYCPQRSIYNVFFTTAKEYQRTRMNI